MDRTSDLGTHLNTSAAAAVPPVVEDALIERARNGDRQAFAALYDRYVERVYRYVYYRVRDDAETEDVTSEAFIKAMVAMPRYESRAPFGAWLCRIAHNVLIDRARSKDVTACRPIDDVVRERELEDDHDGPDGVALLAERRARVREAIRALPPDQQDVIVRRFVEGLSTQEIAHELGRAESTIRGLQMRALRRMRERIAPEDLE